MKKYEGWRVVFIGKGNEALIDILRNEFVHFVNYEKGYLYLSIKK